MARARSPARDKDTLYKKSKGKKKLKDIAAELDVSNAQIHNWKNQDKWDELIKGNVINEVDNVTKRNDYTKVAETNGSLDGRKSSENENTGKRRSGNPSPVKKFSERNRASLKYGLFFRYTPQVKTVNQLTYYGSKYKSNMLRLFVLKK